MHDVLFKPLRLNRAERSQPDVKHQVDPGNLPLGKTRKEFTRKMKASRGGRDRTGPLCENGLVSLAISSGFAPAPDIGRQRSLAVLFQQLKRWYFDPARIQGTDIPFPGVASSL